MQTTTDWLLACTISYYIQVNIHKNILFNIKNDYTDCRTGFN